MELLTKSFHLLKISSQVSSKFVSLSLQKKSLSFFTFENLSELSPSNANLLNHKTHQHCFSANTVLHLHGLSSNICKSSITTLSNHTSQSLMKNENNNQRLFQNSLNPELFTTSCRSIILINENGEKESSDVVLQRFRRLGNGLWIHQLPGRNTQLWKKFLKRKSAWKVFKLRRTVICNKYQSKILDKMVTNDWKKQKWFVEDPYKGYTEESQFYYHPKNLPWNSLELPEDYYKYAIRRNNKGNKLREKRKNSHKYVTNSIAKRIPSVSNGYCFS